MRTFLLLTLLLPTQIQASPKIFFANPIQEIGRLTKGDTTQVTFDFTNIGTLPLKIIEIHADCHCLVTSNHAGINYAPGASGQIAVRFDTKKEQGHFVKSLIVHSNDPLYKDRLVAFAGEVLSDFVIEPQSLDFGQITKDRLKTLTLRFKTLHGFNLGIETLSFNKEYFSVAKRGHQLEVRLIKPPPVGVFKETLRISTNSSVHETIEVWVTGESLGAFVAQKKT